jgi:hypothetical protein
MKPGREDHLMKQIVLAALVGVALAFIIAWALVQAL